MTLTCMGSPTMRAHFCFGSVASEGGGGDGPKLGGGHEARTLPSLTISRPLLKPATEPL